MKELLLDLEPITDYLIVKAEGMDEAEIITKDCPIILSVRVYETVSM
jgi:hypothetical protein